MTETQKATVDSSSASDAMARSERMALRSEIERLRTELDAVYESNTWRTGRLAHRFLSPALQRLRRKGQSDDVLAAPPEGLSGPVNFERGQPHQLTEDLERRNDYEQLLANETFTAPPGRRTLLLVSTEDLDAGRGDLYVACGLGLALVDRGFDVIVRAVGRENASAIGSTADSVVALVPEIAPTLLASDVPAIAWIRNETERWCDHPALDRFAGVFASSTAALDAVRRRFAGPTALLPIGVDISLFFGDPAAERRGVATTVNQWGRERELYRTLKRIPLDFDLEIHGTHLVLAEELESVRRGPTSFFALPSLYRQTELILDDFNHTTLGYGNVNSRVFEALGCGTLVATNGRVGLADVGLDRLPVWADPSTLRRVVSDVLGNSDWRETRARELQDAVVRNHSYERRANEFEAALDTMLVRRGPEPSAIARQGGPARSTTADCEFLYFPDYSSTNPYQSMLYAALPDHGTTVQATDDPFDLSMAERARGRGNNFVFHLHWTAPILGPATGDRDAADRLTRFLGELDRVRDTGGSLIWTIHNVMPHECARPDLELQLRKELVRRADAIHIMSTATADAVMDHYPVPASKTTVIAHSSYTGVYPNTIVREEARSMLGLSSEHRVLLYLGGIRPYRGLDRLLTAFESIAQGAADLRLVVAGRPGRFAEVVELEERCRSHASILPHFNPVPDDELQLFFQAADAAVLPYQQVLNSGSVMLALTYGCPVIAPKLGALDSFLDESFSTPYDPNDPNGLEQAVQSIDRLCSRHARRAALDAARRSSPEDMARSFARLVKDVNHSSW